ncbi:MAG: DinB family protein [Chloroflexi bacterium]|nr:DinB family protein [Chloroflexota bacterium]
MQTPAPAAALLVELEAFATAVSQLLDGEDIEWQWRSAGGEWSITEVVCHLRDVEREVHQMRFRDLIAAENVFLPGVTADDWILERQYQSQDGKLALADFLAARGQTLVLLQSVDEDVWERRGQHAFFGPTSLHELVNLAVKHDQAHFDQLIALRHRHFS